MKDICNNYDHWAVNTIYWIYNPILRVPFSAAHTPISIPSAKGIIGVRGFQKKAPTGQCFPCILINYRNYWILHSQFLVGNLFLPMKKIIWFNGNAQVWSNWLKLNWLRLNWIRSFQAWLLEEKSTVSTQILFIPNFSHVHTLYNKCEVLHTLYNCLLPYPLIFLKGFRIKSLAPVWM